MDRARLVAALSGTITSALANDLVDAFVTIRSDVATRTLGRTAPGKFVETLVQALQQMATGRYDLQPAVDRFLAQEVEKLTQFEDGLRICMARIARSAYALRSKRNIAHKGAVDPNTYDLQFLHASARWIMAELLRAAQGITMEEAGALIDMVHAPVGRLVEEIHGRLIVHGVLSIKDEILVLLHSQHPNEMKTANIIASLDRRNADAVRKQINKLYDEKLVQGDSARGYRLTSVGFDRAAELIAKLTVH